MNIRTLATLAAATAAVPVAQAQDYRGLWAASPTEIWAVADTMAARFDGQAWTLFGLNGGGYHAVGGSSARDVWVVGENGAALRWDGARWTRTSVGQPVTLIAVVARGPGDVWAFGQSDDEARPPVAFRWNGSAWSAQPFAFPFRITAAAVAGADLYVTGYALFDPRPDQRRVYGVLARHTGGLWTTLGFDGRQSNDAVIGATGWTGISAGRGDVLVWGLGSNGLVIQRSSAGGPWTPVPAPTTEATPDEIRIHMAGDGGVIGTFAEHGFGRVARGQWAVVNPRAAASAASQSATESANSADNQRMARMAEDMAKRMQSGQQLTAAEIQQMSEYAQRMAQQGQAQGAANQAAIAQAEAAGQLDFNRAIAIWAPTAADFLVLNMNGGVVRVTGQAGQIIFHPACADPAMAAWATSSPQCRNVRLPVRRVSTGVGPTPVPGAAPAPATPSRPSVNIPSPIRRPKP